MESSPLELVGVILPDGRIDPDGKRFVNDDVELVQVDLPIVSRNPEAQFRYERMRLSGESHSMAEMLATRSFPGIKTDSIFNEGKFSSDAGKVGPEELWLRQQAESAGVSTTGKWYCRGLASFPGDPTAWVGDRGDVMRVLREKNWTSHGYVEHKGHETDPGCDTPIDPDLIEDEVQDILETNPGARAEDVREQVYALRTGEVDPNPLRVNDYDESVFNEDP